MCGNAKAQLTANSIEVNDASDLNALRAACALAWSLQDSGERIENYELPEFSL